MISMALDGSHSFQVNFNGARLAWLALNSISLVVLRLACQLVITRLESRYPFYAALKESPLWYPMGVKKRTGHIWETIHEIIVEHTMEQLLLHAYISSSGQLRSPAIVSVMVMRFLNV